MSADRQSAFGPYWWLPVSLNGINADAELRKWLRPKVRRAKTSPTGRQRGYRNWVVEYGTFDHVYSTHALALTAALHMIATGDIPTNGLVAVNPQQS